MASPKFRQPDISDFFGYIIDSQTSTLIIVLRLCFLVYFYLQIITMDDGTNTNNKGSMSWATLTSAPQQASMDGKEYRLETSIWRDFMLICEGSGRPMIAILKIKTVDSSPFPPDIKADLAWIIYGKNEDAQIWETHVIEEQPRESDVARNYIRVTARNGPKWGPHVNVDVVVQLKNLKRQVALLQATDQKIHRTD